MKVFNHYLSANDLALEVVLISSGQNKIADMLSRENVSDVIPLLQSWNSSCTLSTRVGSGTVYNSLLQLWVPRAA